MEPRQEKLLGLIIENYIKTAEPIGSKFVVEVGDLDLSAPTIRNEMRELEESGFLTHPHTSSGRIPTEQGYQYYVENLMKTKDINKKYREELLQIVKESDNKIKNIKNVAKRMADIANNAVIVAFDSDNVYYTGISNLFSQPEFLDQINLSAVSSIFDQCEDSLDGLFKTVGLDVSILIGQNNPFGSACGLVACKLPNNSLVALVGPMRMNYAESVNLVNFVKELF